MKSTLLRQLFLIALMVWGGMNSAFAQCEYRLEMLDSFGDGWNGGTLDITTGVQTATYSLDFNGDNGVQETVYLSVFNGDPISLNWTPGGFLYEVEIELYDSEDNLVYSISGPPAVQGVIFSTAAECAPCAIPSNLSVDNIYDNRVKISWTPGISTLTGIGWWVIYGPAGFNLAAGQGDTLSTNQPKATVTGLTPKTQYDFYVIQNCGLGETSNIIGPLSLETYWTNDVAVTGILSPASGCDLEVEMILFNMTNLGANPQSLIPYNFYVNGQPGGVPQPEDGYYTGVLGKDSTEVIEFETTYDFSEPGEYEIMVVTQMNGDQDPSNDTFRLYINSRLVAPFAQGFENWDGGWYVAEQSIQPTWQHGEPDGLYISAAAEGQQAWVTGLTDGYNPGEFSYLQSTCFDFSDLNSDPVIEFKRNCNIQPDFDGAYLEISYDGGATWGSVGNIGEGLNWYNYDNTFNNFGEVWSGDTEGWVTSRHSLEGVAGLPEVYLRFVMAGSFFSGYEGIGIDDIKIYEPLQKDMAGLTVTTLYEDEACGSQTDRINVTFANFGAQTITPPFQMSYSINGGPVVTENVTGTGIIPDQIASRTFATAFDSRDVVSVIKVWLTVGGDLNTANDTVVYVVSHVPNAVPFAENFESGFAFPAGWTITPEFNVFIASDHGNISNVIAINLFSGNPTFEYTLPRYGIFGVDDSISFDYRLTNWFEGNIATILTPGTKIELMISTDCGQSFQTIYTVNSINHTPSVNMQTVKVSLADYAGESAIFRFKGTHTGGDFWVDIDNVNLAACPADFDLTAQITHPGPGQSNGSATVSVGIGNPPYLYDWSNGATTATVSGLSMGNYTVTVADSHGCFDTLTVYLGNSTVNDLNEVVQLSIRPNPTNGMFQLDLKLEASAQLQAELYNMMGQRIWSLPADRPISDTWNEWIDLSGQPDGVYLMRLMADGRALTRKVVKQQ